MTAIEKELPLETLEKWPSLVPEQPQQNTSLKSRGSICGEEISAIALSFFLRKGDQLEFRNLAQEKEAILSDLKPYYAYLHGKSDDDRFKIVIKVLKIIAERLPREKKPLPERDRQLVSEYIEKAAGCDAASTNCLCAIL